MSTEYYLSNRKKQEEIQAFNKFWEEELIPEFKQKIIDYCKKADGRYVNEMFAEQIIEEKITDISAAPGDSQGYETIIGVSRWSGKRPLFQWEGSYIEDCIIRDEGSLVGFFASKTNQERYCIVDENHKEYTLKGFLEKIKA